MELTDKQAAHFAYIATELAKGESPSNVTIARALGGFPSAAGHIVKRLVTAKLLDRTSTRKLRLTKSGRKRAIDLGISPASSPAEERAQIVWYIDKTVTLDNCYSLDKRIAAGEHWTGLGNG